MNLRENTEIKSSGGEMKKTILNSGWRFNKEN